MGAVQVQVLELDPGEVAVAERLELVLDRLADPAHGRLGHGRPLAECLCERSLDVTGGQAFHVASDGEGLDGVGAGHALAEQARGERLGRAPQLRAAERDRPGRRVDGERAVAVARAVLGVLSSAAPLVAAPVEVFGYLCLEGGLEQQASSQAGHLLEHFAELALGGEQLVYLCADAFDA